MTGGGGQRGELTQVRRESSAANQQAAHLRRKTLNQAGRSRRLPMFAWPRLDSGVVIRAEQGLS